MLAGLDYLIKHHSYDHIEIRLLICCANQLTRFYMMATMAFNELKCYSTEFVQVTDIDTTSISMRVVLLSLM